MPLKQLKTVAVFYYFCLLEDAIFNQVFFPRLFLVNHHRSNNTNCQRPVKTSMRPSSKLGFSPFVASPTNAIFTFSCTPGCDLGAFFPSKRPMATRI